MDVKKNHVLVGKERVYDQELIYTRVIGLLTSSREINFNDVLAFELAAYPPSMFNADGKMNVATSKTQTTSDYIERNCPISDTIIYHVSALPWVITWPSGKLHVYVDAFKAFVHQALRRANVILVFDRYFPNSIKTFTRTQSRRDLDQVASINWHTIRRLQRSKSSSPTPKTSAYRRHSRPARATSPKQDSRWSSSNSRTLWCRCNGFISWHRQGNGC